MVDNALLVPDEDLPSEELMAEINVPLRDYADFLKAFRFTLLVSQGISITKACDEVGLNRRSVYTERWKDFVGKAKRVIMGRAMLGVTAASNSVFEQWPQMINRLIKDVLSPVTETRDRVAAMEFLFMAYVGKEGVELRDDQAERQFLKDVQGFNPNPMAPITINAEHVSIGQSPSKMRTVDVEANEE